MKNASDYNLDAMVADWAIEIFEQSDDLDAAIDMAHQKADGTEWVIYYAKAHELCAKCNTDNGEQFLEDVGHPETVTYDSLAVSIAYGEIYSRIAQAVQGLYEMAEEIEGAA
jgi:hypothetical protein